MIAKANKKITIHAEIPSSALDKVLAALSPYKVVVVEDDDLIEVAETSWYAATKASIAPGENMRMYREKFGWTQTELGARLGGKTRHYVSAMESGKRPISKVVALKLAELFGVSVEGFIG